VSEKVKMHIIISNFQPIAVPFYSAVTALSQTINDTVNEKDAISISDIVAIGKKSGRPIVLFIEGTTTNGKLLLSTYPALDQTKAIATSHVIAFK
jgi:1-acyl-sn-glycerol-3-phosphate acyltransferase